MPEKRLPMFRQWLEAVVGGLANYAVNFAQAASSAPDTLLVAVSTVPATPAGTGHPIARPGAIILFFKPKVAAARAADLKKRGIVPVITFKTASGALAVGAGSSQRSENCAWSSTNPVYASSQSLCVWSGSAAA